MAKSKSFFELLNQLDLEPADIKQITDSWEVKTLEFDQKGIITKLELKQLLIVPHSLISTFINKFDQHYRNSELIWGDQIVWSNDLVNIQTYLQFFFRDNLSTTDLPTVAFQIKLFGKQGLKILFASQYLADLFGKDTETQQLLFFLRQHGIYVDKLNVLFNAPQTIKPTTNPFADEMDEVAIRNEVQKIKEGCLEGKILAVNNKMFSNKQTFSFLVEGTEETRNFVLSKEATIFDRNRDTDLLKKGNWLRVYFSKVSEQEIRQNHHQRKNNFHHYVHKTPRYPVIKFEAITPIFKRSDDAPQKRVELHVHTKMSALDGIGEVEDYLAYANHWKHQAIAITDHQNVHAFPECDRVAQKFPDLKVIFGCEFEFLSQAPKVLTQSLKGNIADQTILFFDLETTGLSPYFDEIIEFAGVVVQNSIVVQKESFLIQCKKTISPQIYQFTHINKEEHVQAAIPFQEAMLRIKKLFANHLLVAHNASFDITFLNVAFAKLGIAPILNPILDTLILSYFVEPNLSSHRLQRLARKYKVPYSKLESHRAIYDTKVVQKLFENIINLHKISTFDQLLAMNTSEAILNKGFYDHIILLAKNQQGLRDLYHLVSHTHTITLYKKPLLLQKDLEKYRQNLLVGSGCYNGEVFKAACFSDDQTLLEKMALYDYIEIQPLEVYTHLVIKEILSAEDIKQAVFRIVKTAQNLNKRLVATGDVHYLEPEHRFYRDVFVFNKQLGGEWHDLYDFKNRLKKTPKQYFRTTNEMLAAFAFLEDEQLIQDLVITNPNWIADQIERVRCFDDQFIMPQFENADNELKTAIQKKMLTKYGPHPDRKVQKRLNQELKNIIDAQYSTIYLISYYLTEFCTQKKYFFGSRGSVGSSFVANCLDITEVNPLSPHYLCGQCYYFEWVEAEQYLSGFDLPDKKCPNCQQPLKKDGHEISFETFLGLDSENIPDIDLNFSGEFQQRAQQFVVDLFTKRIGEKRIFWTGTVSTVAEKSAYGYYKSFLETYPLRSHNNQNQVVAYCSGVKKTTGQHPGGLMIIPKTRDILDFSPYNYPSNKKEGGNLTTHFDYHVLHNRLLKIDILGHDDPTGLKMLYELTDVNPKDIELGKPDIIQLFAQGKVLGLPEFGTKFVLRLLKDVNVRTFADLIAISGLSHGKNVWESNARDLISDHRHSLSSVISSRDDILFFLIKNNVTRKFAYEIMQKVKKGKLLSNVEEKRLQKHNIPQWYIDSCKKIKYLFPKAHAVAYVIMACRFAWFKIHHPAAFYAVYFSIHAVVFDLTTILKGKEAVVAKIQELSKYKQRGNETISPREKALLPLYEVAVEMFDKGIRIVDLDLQISQEKNFLIQEVNGKKVLIPPFSVVDRLGLEFAKKIISERTKKSFTSQEDFKTRTGINKSAFDNLIELKLFTKLNKSKQNTFDF